VILQALAKHYETLAQKNEIAKLGWVRGNVAFALELDHEGALLNVIPLLEKKRDQKGKEKEVPKTLDIPERVNRTSGVLPNFMCDSSGYILGFDHKGNAARSIECFSVCKELHIKILEPLESLTARAVYNFFTSWEPETAITHNFFQPYRKALETGNLIFMVDGKYAQEDSEIQKAWQNYNLRKSGEAQMRCLVTGDMAPVAILHGKIKGVAGAQSSGGSIVSFNERAYESYGKKKEQGKNAPVGEYAAFAYVSALNHLLADNEHRRQIGDATVVYWGEDADKKKAETFNILAFKPDEDGGTFVKNIMRKLAAGLPVAGLSEDDMKKRFFILGLAPNAARISVRFFLRNSFGTMLQNLRRHYLDLEIVKASFDKEYLSIPALLRETTNPKSKDKKASPQLAGEILRAILAGTPYPASLYQAVLRRIRAERQITRVRVAIIKACLNRNSSSKGVCLTVSLNTDNHNPAYVLGRLFAVLEKIQYYANQDINVTIKDRCFNAASATPSVMFPQLIKLSNFHIKKIQSERKGLAVNLEKRKGELIGMLEAGESIFPARLFLKEQGLFIGGYYQQRQADFEKGDKKRQDSAENNGGESGIEHEEVE
jgi:CRISPR-associated protein Csd1